MPESFVLKPVELNLLQPLVGSTVDQLVWDLNAVYFVVGKSTIKVESAVGTPVEVTNNPNAEVAYITVENERSTWRRFRPKGQRGYWYKVLATNARIDNIELARTSVLLPSEVPQSPGGAIPSDQHAFLADAGVVVSVAGQVLPAVQLQNSYGFAIWPVPQLFRRDEALSKLEGSYELLPVITAA